MLASLSAHIAHIPMCTAADSAQLKQNFFAKPGTLKLPSVAAAFMLLPVVIWDIGFDRKKEIDGLVMELISEPKGKEAEKPKTSAQQNGAVSSTSTAESSSSDDDEEVSIY